MAETSVVTSITREIKSGGMTQFKVEPGADAQVILRPEDRYASSGHYMTPAEARALGAALIACANEQSPQPSPPLFKPETQFTMPKIGTPVLQPNTGNHDLLARGPQTLSGNLTVGGVIGGGNHGSSVGQVAGGGDGWTTGTVSAVGTIDNSCLSAGGAGGAR